MDANAKHTKVTRKADFFLRQKNGHYSSGSVVVPVFDAKSHRMGGKLNLAPEFMFHLAPSFRWCVDVAE